MRFIARHITRFRYTAPVFLEPHAIRLRPRSESSQRLVRFRMAIDPQPFQLSEVLDSEGNSVAHAWFSELTDSLVIRTEFEVETSRVDPFDYLLLGEGSMRVPVEYPAALRTSLAGGLARSEPDASPVDDFARRVAKRSGNVTLKFLTLLNEEIHDRHRLIVREHGDPLPPGETLATERVACRDLAVLFADCCRSVGIASRFVSGYTASETEADDHHMHAWAEVYLPGGGWRGYDPSQGLAVADRHIAVASASVASCAAPTSGSFRGDAVAGPLEVEIAVNALEHELTSSVGSNSEQ